MKADLERVRPGLYDAVQADARASLGLPPDKGKPLIARYIAEQLVAQDIVPDFAREITRHLKQKLGLALPPTRVPSDDLDECLDPINNPLRAHR